jgi:mRNA deadenylase 3'-5' endonuclease subunit Ccr4
MSFKVATYNVLATAYIRPEWYRGVPPGLLDPAWRVPALASHVEGLDADLLCLQEVEADVFAALDGRLAPRGYLGLYERKGGGRPDGCATFFRQTTLTLHRSQRLDYHDRGPGQTADSGHISLLMGLEHERRLLGVANTHVRWDRPGTPPSEQVGRRQVVELLAACGRFTPPCDGWLVCGDFNRTPDDEVIAVMREAGFQFAHERCPAAQSCVANGRARLIDYVFHSASLRSRPVAPPVVGDDTRLPSPGQPSDHLALAAAVEWA